MRLTVEQKQVQSQVPSQQMQQALFLLRMNAWELNEYVRDQAIENPVLEVVEPEWQQWDSAAWNTAAGEVYEKAAPQTLESLLLQQLNIKTLNASELAVAREIIASLDGRGYFTGNLEELEQLYGAAPEEVRRALRAVQELDPAGVGATDLSECLTLQLARMGVQEEAPYKIARDYLGALAKEQYTEIASNLGITRAKSREYGALIRSLNPGVSNDTDSEKTQYIYPEIAIEREEDRLKIYLDEKKLIRPMLNPEYKLEDLDGEAKKYLRECYAQAKRMIASVDLWKSMLQRTAEQIVLAQQQFFLQGKPLMPLKMSEIAQVLDVHTSTVSRAVAGKYVLYEGKAYPLKSFFARQALDTKQQISTDYVRKQIKELLGMHPKLSDQAVAEYLKQKGVGIARRTVAKYRKELGIASSYKRKKN